MPLYNFRCERCGREFELLCSIADKQEQRAACPACGATTLHHQYGRVAIRVKSSEPDCPHGGSCPGCCGGCG